MSTADDGRIIVFCDGLDCPEGGRYHSYIDASLSGWHLQFTKDEGTPRKDYCDPCFRAMVEPVQSITLGREDAEMILAFLRESGTVVDGDYRKLLNAEVKMGIVALEEALRK